ncbi:MAG: ferrochelatase [Myxococcales bacterium]
MTSTSATSASTVRGLLVIAFGGPHKIEDVRPFLRNVLEGRPVPEERFESVVHHYELLGGSSPITAHTERQAELLSRELAARGHPLEVRVGMRHWSPWLKDSLEAFRAGGHREVFGLIMAAQETEASLARYVAAVEKARAELGADAPVLRLVRGFGLSDAVVEAHVEHLEQALATLPSARRARAEVLFTAHSIPQAMASGSPYVSQLDETTRRVAARFDLCGRSSLVYQSRSGNPREPWLEPDVLDALTAAKQRGVEDVVALPIGFLCDHVEVLYDLDIEARRHAESLGLGFVRASTLGTHPAFIRALADSVIAAVHSEQREVP